MAPLSYSFIGSYFPNPYYARYDEALNLASLRLLADEGGDANDEGRRYDTLPTKASRPYTLVRAKNVGLTAILLFARDPAAVRHGEEAECGFGAADMGNKGAVGLRVTYEPQDAGGLARTTEVTLVATHLAAMEWNLKKRNANWRTIMSSLTFANPRALLPGVFPANSSAASTAGQSGGGGPKFEPPPAVADSSDSSEAEADGVDNDNEDDAQKPLLKQQADELNDRLTAEHRAMLRDASVFKPTTHLFVAGDLNYRISSTTPPPLASFPSFDMASEHHYSNFLPRDQLTQERLAGRAFHGMTEAPVTFGPTYKFNVLDSAAGAANEAAVRAGAAPNGVPEVPWRFAPHRWPGWCDRVLYLDVPAWVAPAGRRAAVDVRAYDALPVVRTSDHRPVFFRAAVPLLRADEMRPSPEAEMEGASSRDPRLAPPVPVDVHAWERRAAARRREVLVGWSAFFWSTKEGALVMTTLLALGFGIWWLWRG